MKNTEQKIPALRFPEFSGEWEEKKLGEITKINQGLQIAIANRLTEKTPDSHFYITNEFLKKESDKKYYIINPPKSVLCNKEDILMTRTGNTGIVVTGVEGAFHNNFFKIQFDKSKYNGAFFINFLRLEETQKQIIRYAGSSTIPDLNHSDFYRLIFSFPSLSEQQKIADFLSAIDKRLQLLKDKKTKLEEYKRGVMQRIFSQELRFTRPDGSAYPDWDEKRLGELGTTYNGLSGKTSEDFGDGRPYIQYKQIFDSSRIDINKCGFVNIVNGEKQNEVAYGDILFTTSSETPHEVGFSSVILDEVKNTYLNSFCFGFRPNSLTELYPSFSRYLFRSETVRKDIITLAQGSTRYNMSKIEFLKISTFIPHLDEQRQIADFLSAIDDKIALLTKQIESTEQYKKGLLQQMFV